MFEKLLASKEPKLGKVKLIAIDGHGGSGKSTVAKLLAEKLNAEIIQIDDFTGWDRPKNWRASMVDLVFTPITEGATQLSYRRAKWWPNHEPQPVVNQPVSPVMILEGVTALRKEFRPYISLGIYVEAPSEISMQRGIERDIASGTGKTKADIAMLWQSWSESEDAYINRDKPNLFADIIIDGTLPIELQLN